MTDNNNDDVDIAKTDSEYVDSFVLTALSDDDDESVAGLKKNEILGEVKKAIRECSELKVELVRFKSSMPPRYDYGVERRKSQNTDAHCLNIATLLDICHKIIVDCSSLDELPAAELRFLKDIAYAAGIRQQTQKHVHPVDSSELDTCLARINQLRTILHNAKENTKSIKAQMTG